MNLDVPLDYEIYDNPILMTIQSGGSGKIWIMPYSENGHGVLGKVSDGTKVEILAARQGRSTDGSIGTFYFFVTEDGMAGWNHDYNFKYR